MTTVPVPTARAAQRGRRLGWVFAHLLWSTEVVGAQHVPATGPVILAANHTGVADGPLLAGIAPRGVHILVKQEMFTGPIGAVLRRCGQIPVDREQSRQALATSLAVLQRGGVVGIFPEGNRGEGRMTGARAGVSWLAVHGHAPVVPVAILGTRRTGHAVGRLPGLRRRIVVELGEPVVVPTDGLSRREAIAAGAELIGAAVARLVHEAGERHGLAQPDDSTASG